MPEVKVQNASLTFVDSRKESNVVYEDLSITAPDGGFTVLLGPSGCGKSTILNVIAGLISTTSDKGILLDGVDVREKPQLRRQIGYIFQDARLLPWKTLAENVRFAMKGLNIRDHAEWDALADKYFEIVGLSDRKHFYPHQLSGGMQQRASIVRAWANEPQLLLMDEPFSHLDEITSAALRGAVSELWLSDETRRTILFVTHNLREAALLATNVVVMTPAPARIAYSRHIDLPFPRDAGDQAVFELESELREVLRRITGVNV